MDYDVPDEGLICPDVFLYVTKARPTKHRHGVGVLKQSIGRHLTHWVLETVDSNIGGRKSKMPNFRYTFL